MLSEAWKQEEAIKTVPTLRVRVHPLCDVKFSQILVSFLSLLVNFVMLVAWLLLSSRCRRPVVALKFIAAHCQGPRLINEKRRRELNDSAVLELAVI